MTDTLKIYHNPRCSKSRQTLQLLTEHGLVPQIVCYLETPPAAAEIEYLIDLLGIEPLGLVRTNEAAYSESGLDTNASRAMVAAAIAAQPILLQRPVVVLGSRAVIARPPERVLSLFEHH